MEGIKKLKKTVRPYVSLRLLDLHDRRNVPAYIAISIFALAVLAILVRVPLIYFGNADYFIFASWYDFVKVHGIASFSTDFSNYNPPYTYFLYIVTLLPINETLAIKSLMFLFDLLLGFSVYLLVRQIGHRKVYALCAGLITLFLPAVIANGVFWGQFDQLYTAFTFISLYYVLRNNSKLAWLFFGIAIAIKLQAIFFLPVLIIMSFRRIRLIDSLYGIGAFIVLTFLPVLAGRSIGSILNIYTAQTSLFKGNLTLNAPNIYTWIPNTVFTFVNNAGIYFTLAAVIVLFIYAIYKQTFSDRSVLLLSTLSMMLIPFILPQMHERYFFSGVIMFFVLAIYLRRAILAAITAQIVIVFSFIPFLFAQEPPISMGNLALFNMAVIGYLIFEYVKGESVGTRVRRVVAKAVAKR